ncbi:MAG: SDH family Clp fold serine proteinase [Candidatus Omnitrophota bacterium]|jgi:hypothetical protein
MPSEIPEEKIAPTQPVQAPSAPPKYAFNIFPPQGQIFPDPFVKSIDALELSLGMPVWFFVLNDSKINNQIDYQTSELILSGRKDLARNQPIALIIDSGGGSAKEAYRIATLLRQHCGQFTALIPRYAKSAATLLSLGADNIVMSRDAELGPLDVQIYDGEREERSSALDEVQALQRLHAFALESFDSSMLFLLRRTGKKMDTLIPNVFKFVTDMTTPLFNKIDAVHYSQMARALKVGEEYAARLLQVKYPNATEIARKLVENYPEHGFVIDHEETKRIGLKTVLMSEEQENIFAGLKDYLRNMTLIGRLKKV